MSDHLSSADAVSVETLGLDAFESGLLSVLRQFLTGYAHAESQAWQLAFALATEGWGAARGPQVAMGLLPVMQSLRRVRRDDFEFANPLCITSRGYATGTEAAFARMLQAMRRDRTNLARGAVLILSEGKMDHILIQAALAVATRYPAEAEDAPILRPDGATCVWCIDASGPCKNSQRHR